MQIPYSLAISYLLLGTAIGMVIWFTTARILDKERFGASSQRMILIAVVLAVLGIIFATAHLGRMERFMNLVSNPDSWLSREGFFAGGFTGLLLLYYLLIRNKAQEQVRKVDILLYLAALAGLGTFISMGMIYASVSAVPAWSSFIVVLVDILSGLVLGGVLFLLLLDREQAEIFKPLVKGVFAVLLVSLLVNIIHQVQVGMTLSALAAQGVEVPSIWLGSILHLLVGLIIPAYVLAKMLKPQDKVLASGLTIAMVCVVIGEVTAKMMHFVVAVKGPLF